LGRKDSVKKFSLKNFLPQKVVVADCFSASGTLPFILLEVRPPVEVTF
jgi:hypothetical protein